MNRKVLYPIFSLIFLLLIFQMQCTKGEKQKEGREKTAQVNSKTDKSGAELGEAAGQVSANSTEAVPVEVATVNQGAISAYLLLSSNLETEKMADVYSRVQGLVGRILVEEGDQVKKGQVLMELEADEYTLAEHRAQVSFQQKKNAFERAKLMHEKKLLSKEEFEQVKFSTEAEEITWQEAQLKLSYTKISAPISGVVGERLRRLGDRIQPTDKLFSIINNDEMIAVVHIPEKEIERVSKDQTAYVLSNHLKDKQYDAWVKRVSPAVDPQSGTFKVTVGVNNANKKLKPGMFVNVHIVTDVHENAVLIPKTAIVYENEIVNVFVVRDSIAHKVQLKVGFQSHDQIESLQDIKPEEKVIVVGQAGLKDKTKVKVVSNRKNS